MRLRLLEEAEDESRTAANWYARSQEGLGEQESEFIVLAIAHAKQRSGYWLKRKTDSE